jgi:hypothetical protein
MKRHTEAEERSGAVGGRQQNPRVLALYCLTYVQNSLQQNFQFDAMTLTHTFLNSCISISKSIRKVSDISTD